MGKLVHDDVLDLGLNHIKTTCTAFIACSTQPTNYTEAAVTYKLADVVATSGNFTLANGDTSGRKITMAAKTSVPIDNSGTFGHVALCNTASSKLLYVTTGTSQVLTAGNSVDFPAWDIELADPTA